jgi:hypothetical protein
MGVCGLAVSRAWKFSGGFFQGLEKPRPTFSKPWKLAALFFCTAALADEARLELRNERLAVALSQKENGAIVSLRTSGGEELAAVPQSPILFALTFSKKATPPGEKFTLTSHDAKSFRVITQPQSITLTYDGLADWPVCVTCIAQATAGDLHLRWRISVQVPEGLVLEAVRFPIITLRTAPTADDAVVLGSTKGGVIRHPSAMKPGSSVSIAQPGNMAAQFGCLYTPRSGFFTAALDGRGYPKQLLLTRTGNGIEFSWYRPCFASDTLEQEYDVALTTFSGAGGAPTDWRDAADLYKAWALMQPWCATTYDKRTDIPAWMKDGPAMVRFSREWLAEPVRIERWLAEYWQKYFPNAPLIMAFWGWEKVGSWVTPDYFPVFPSDEQFTQLVARARAAGAHAFPWPSGYHWTLTYQKQSDGTFKWDDRQRFGETARSHAVQLRDGKLHLRTPSWLAGGDTTCLCGGDPWTLRWWNEDICVPLARRGCEMIQVDQVVGGSYPACYDRTHPHPPGPGVWQTEMFTRQLQTMYAAMKKIQPDTVVCFEEPNEWYNHLVGLQDYRDCETPHAWASVFNYLYHEFLPPFQSNPRGNDLVMMAHCLVDGQMPHMVPSGRDLAEPVLVNGGFEPRAGSRHAVLGWDQVHSYQGQNWTGTANSDALEKHSGVNSLRLENTNKADVVQISQNVMVSSGGLVVGKKYRLGAWLKTAHMAKQSAIGFGFLAPGLKSLGHGGRLPFPAAGAGWTQVTADCTVPAGAEMLRIMIHVTGTAKAWADEVTLDEILPDGSIKPVHYTPTSLDARLMQRWVALYHGAGRPWLQFGRMLHPPPLACATNTYQAASRRGDKYAHTERALPAVFHNAFRAPDGAEAVVLANTTRETQHVTLKWKGQDLPLDLPPADALLIK